MLRSAVHDAAVRLWSALPTITTQQTAIRKRNAKKKEEHDQLVTQLANDDPNAAAPAAPEPEPLLSEQDITATSIPSEEVRAIFANLYRAAFANALLDDCRAAAAAVPLPTSATANADNISKGGEAVAAAMCSFAVFKRLLRQKLTSEWSDPRCVRTSVQLTHRPSTSATNASSRPGTSFEKGDAVSATPAKPLTAVEEYLLDTVACVVDDREPNGLLPLQSVWIRSAFPLSVEQSFANFAKMTAHPAHAAVYDRLWARLHNLSEEQQKEQLSKDQFTLFFQCFYRAYFTNGVPERGARAAAHLWYEATRATGTMTMGEFQFACSVMGRMYLRRVDTEALLTEFETALFGGNLDAALGPFSTALLEDLSPLPAALTLDDPQSLFVLDELNEDAFEATHMRRQTPNRVLVTGPEGTQGTSVARALAQTLNAVLLEVNDLAIRAADRPTDRLGAMLRHLVADMTPIPLYLQAALFARALADPATEHRGYVCGDLPPLNAATARLFLADCGLEKSIPQALVELSCPSALTDAAREAAIAAEEGLYEHELHMRDEEQAAIDAAVAKEQESKARSARNHALRLRKDAIEAKGADAEPEELEVLDQQEEEEPEEPPQLDENGDELTTEEIHERDAKKLAATRRRRFLADLRHLIVQGRQAHTAETTSYTSPITHPALAKAKEICEARRRVLSLGHMDTAENLAKAITTRLGLTTSVVPSRPELPEDVLESLGTEFDTPEYTEALAEALESQVSENKTRYPVSRWLRHCPVTFTVDGVLVEGAPEFILEYRGYVYYLASPEKAAKFQASPHRYLTSPVGMESSLLLLPSRLDAFSPGPKPEKELLRDKKCAPQYTNAQDLVQQTAARLRLTPVTLGDYVAERKRQQKEIDARYQEHMKRLSHDIKARKEADERAKKRADLEAKRRKKEEKTKKKSTKKAAGAAGGAGAGGDDDDAPEAADEDDGTESAAGGATQVSSATVAKIQALIHLKRRVLTMQFLPQLVTVLEPITSGEIEFLLEQRTIPPNVALLTKDMPPPPVDDEDEFGDEELGEEEEDEESEAEDAQGGDDDVDEDGQPVAKVQKVIDLTDPKQYKRFVKSLLEKFENSTATAEEEATDMETTSQNVTPTPSPTPSPQPPQTPAGNAGADADAAGGSQPPKPSQSFKVTSFSAYNKSAEQLAAEVTMKLHPSVLQPTPFEDELLEDVADEDEIAEEGAEPAVDPLLIPGLRAVHQFGFCGRYCPVAIKFGALVLGSPEFVVDYRHKKYLFPNEAAMRMFIEDPERYVSTDTPVVIAPPRLWVLGVQAAGKSTICTRLAKAHTIPLFDAFAIDYFEELMAAAASADGATVRGLFIPAQSNEALTRAQAIRQTLTDFAENQKKKQEAKETTAAAQAERERLIEEGEEVDELDEAEEEAIEAALAFEPEEEEASAERVALAHRQIGAWLTRIEPFASSGYILQGFPAQPQDLSVMLKTGAYPDAVLRVNISAEVYVSRLFDTEWSKKNDAYQKLVWAFKEKRNQKMVKAREEELRRWRYRNIGMPENEEEAAGGDNEDDEPEEPEALDEDAIKTDLENTFETEQSNIAALADILPERRIPLVDVSGNGGFDTVYSAVQAALFRFLDGRPSLLEAPMVLKHKDAQSLVAFGAKSMSSFGEVDCVALYNARFVNPVERLTLRSRKTLSLFEEEDEIPEPQPHADDGAEKPRRKKIVQRENEEGEMEEFEEDEEEPEEPEAADDAAAGEGEDEEEAYDEPEPELDPDELAEMKEELDARKARFAEKKMPRAAVFRNRVYFFKNDVNLLAFVRSPFQYWDQPPPPPAVPAITVVIEGDSATAERIAQGERPTARQLAESTNAVFISITKLLTWSLQRRDAFPPDIWEGLADCLLRGAAVTPKVLTMLLTARLGCADVALRGAVISDVIGDAADYQRLASQEGITATSCITTDAAHRVAIFIAAKANTVHVLTGERFSTAELVDAVRRVNAARKAQERLEMSRLLGFPSPILNTSVTLQSISEGVTAAYRFYCPRTWAVHGELIEVDQRGPFLAEFLGQYFCFSEEDFLRSFLVEPHVYELANSGQELPSTLPRRMDETEAAAVEEASLELFGCCPVTLYDTRERIGLCGVLDPLATKGTIIVFYNDKYYALNGEEPVARFLRRPWVFVESAVLPPPERLPQPKAVVKATTDHTKYVKLALHEPIARAMLALAEVRPKYPKMSADESARKFLALFLRAHNPENTPVAAAQHAQNLAEFTEIATLYRTIPSAEPENETEVARCGLWDSVLEHPALYQRFAQLRETHNDPERTVVPAAVAASNQPRK